MKTISPKSGFTLVELMLAVVISAIVMASVGFAFVYLHKANTKFIQEKVTMEETMILHRLFDLKSQGSSSLNPNTGELIFDAGTASESSITYNSNNNAVVYDPDTSIANNEINLLENSVIAAFSAEQTNNITYVNIQVVEAEMQQTNTYRFYSFPRNN